jgi:outer membrane protein insertion porin family
VISRASLTLLAGALLFAAPPSDAQVEPGTHVADSIVVQGARRLTPKEVLQTAGLTAGQPVGYRDVQRAIQALYATGQFADVQVVEDNAAGRRLLIVRVREEPILVKWTVRGVLRLSERSVKE